MADAATNWIVFAVSLAPVAQTAIWAGVAVTGLLMLRKPLRQLAAELVERVNQGDHVSTPWLSIEKREERERKVVEQVTKDIRGEISGSEAKRGKSLNIDETEIEEILGLVKNKFVDLVFPADQFTNSKGQDITISLYMTQWLTVSDFLNEAYLSAREAGVEIPIWSYGRYWRLENDRTKEAITKSRLGNKDDSRDFSVLDVRAGDTLIAKRLA